MSKENDSHLRMENTPKIEIGGQSRNNYDLEI